MDGREFNMNPLQRHLPLASEILGLPPEIDAAEALRLKNEIWIPTAGVQGQPGSPLQQPRRFLFLA